VTPPCDIPCRDYWPHGIPDEKLAIYKQLISAGLIANQRVIYNKKTGSVIVEYDSQIPHEWILDHARQAVAEGVQLEVTA